jgi:hypothetical protein
MKKVIRSILPENIMPIILAGTKHSKAILIYRYNLVLSSFFTAERKYINLNNKAEASSCKKMIPALIITISTKIGAANKFENIEISIPSIITPDVKSSEKVLYKLLIPALIVEKKPILNIP